MALTRTPSGPYSAAHALVKSSSAAFVEPYSAIPGIPKLATIVETLTIAPPPLSAMRGANAPVRKNGALTFSANVESNTSLSTSSVGPNGNAPASLTSTSTRSTSLARR